MTKKRMHFTGENHRDAAGAPGAENASSFAWLDEESGELLRVQVWSTNETFVDEFTSMGFQAPPLRSGIPRSSGPSLGADKA